MTTFNERVCSFQKFLGFKVGKIIKVCKGNEKTHAIIATYIRPKNIGLIKQQQILLYNAFYASKLQDYVENTKT